MISATNQIPSLGRSSGRQKWITFRGTRKSAEKELTRLLGTLDNGTYVEPATTTLLEWLRQWVKVTVATSARSATLTRYRGIVENHIAASEIANTPLQKLRPSHLEAYYASIPAGSRPVHHTVIRRALRKAVKERLLKVNPAADLDHAPRRARERDDEAAQACWTAEEARTFLAAAKNAGTQPHAFYAVALDTGARKGELCGLRWSDVALEGGKLRIVQQLTKPGPEPTFGTTKGGRGRTVTLAAETVELLKAHRRAQAELKMRNRMAYRDFGLVFAKEYGDLSNRQDMIGLSLQGTTWGSASSTD